MAHHVRVALAHVKARMTQRFPVDVDELARAIDHRWRERTLTPAMTIWFFALQILNGNCAINALRHLGNLPTQASSYCTARMKLPLALFARLFDAISRMAASADRGVTLLNGRRVLLADATSFSMPDTPELRDHFGYPSGQRVGCGFPVAKLLGVIDAFSGAVLVAMGCPLFTHEAREMLALHPLLRKRGRSRGGSRVLLLCADRAVDAARRGRGDAASPAARGAVGEGPLRSVGSSGQASAVDE